MISLLSLLGSQILRLRRLIGCSFLMVSVLLALPVVAKLKWNIPAEQFTRDPLALLEAPLYTGLLSNVGILLWCAAATVCFFGGVILRRTTRELYWFWICAGALTTALLLDDLFLLHEEVYPLHLGIPENLVYSVYGAALAAFPLRFYRTILRTDCLLLLLAFGFFAASLGVDALDGIVEIRGFYLFEDGFKLFGIVGWFLYFARTAHHHVSVLVTDPTRAPQLTPP